MFTYTPGPFVNIWKLKNISVLQTTDDTWKVICTHDNPAYDELQYVYEADAVACRSFIRGANESRSPRIY
jgi:hypothetical protein